MRSVKCPKCHGTGIRPEYAHVDNGKCYHCQGLGRYKRVAPTKRETMADYLARQNMMITEKFGN